MNSRSAAEFDLLLRVRFGQEPDFNPVRRPAGRHLVALHECHHWQEQLVGVVGGASGPLVGW